jgi:hypothetical protein
MLALVAGGIVALGAGGAIAVHELDRHGEAPEHPPAPPPPGPPSVEVTLPTTVDTKAELPAVSEGTIVDVPSPDQLGAELVHAAWCSARQHVVIAVGDGRILTLDRSGNVDNLGTVNPGTKGGTTALACAPDGRVVGVINGSGVVIEGGTFRTVAGAPPGLRAGVAVRGKLRWISPGAIWEWNGDGSPARRIRDACDRPQGAALSPDGESVVCADNTGRIILDDGKRIVLGPRFPFASWSPDSRSILVLAFGGVARWRPGAAKEEHLATGTSPVEVGKWLVTIDRGDLVRTALNKPEAAALAPIPLGVGQVIGLQIIATIPEHDEIVVAYRGAGLRVVSLSHPKLDVLADRHLIPPETLVYSPDGTKLASRAAGKLITRSLVDHTREAGPFVDEMILGGQLVWRANGDMFTLLGGSIQPLTGAHQERHVVEGASLTVIAGSDEIAATTAEGIRTVTTSGELSDWLMHGEVPTGIEAFQIDSARRHAMILPFQLRPRILDLPSGKLLLDLRSEKRLRVTQLIAGPSPALAVIDEANELFIAEPGNVRPVTRFDQPVTKMVSAPVGRRLAITIDTAVLVYDLDRGAFTLQGKLSAHVTALAWSRDGKHLAAAASNTEIRVWNLP